MRESQGQMSEAEAFECKDQVRGEALSDEAPARRDRQTGSRAGLEYQPVSTLGPEGPNGKVELLPEQ